MLGLLVALVLVAAACDGGGGEVEAGEFKADVGVDVDNRILTIAALNDVSGPAAVIGEPFALGKRILVDQINAGGSGLLPEGWTIELVERDHGYNPTQSVQAYNEVKDSVLFIATSFGTPNTLPLQPLLAQDNLIAFPASLSSAMAVNEFTPPIGAPYTVEAMRAMEFAIEQAGGAESVRAGIVYQDDDYGADGLAGWRAAAEFHGVEIVSEQRVSPTQNEFTANVTALQEAGANFVLLTTLPGATANILGTAAGFGYEPTWIGNTPSWVDALSNPSILPTSARENYYWVSSLPLWREEAPGIDAFHKAYAQFGADEHLPDFYILASYLQGLVEIEAFRRALESGDVTREGYKQALRSISDFDAGGLFVQPVDLSTFPYVTGSQVRVLSPGNELLEWNEVSGFATPEAFQG
jgi:ABC-type branched-subunit amino acid transport system substrate-binding protein